MTDRDKIEMQLEAEQRDAADASNLLKNRTFVRLFAEFEERYRNEWEKSAFADVSRREEAYQKLNALRSLRDELTKRVSKPAATENLLAKMARKVVMSGKPRERL
jgi:hypothetical protein